jgi:subtilisin family serine protease
VSDGALRPAWSEAFDDQVLRPVLPLLPDGITRDWAWGDATGAGVDVAVIDSGIEAGHPLVGEVASAVALTYDPDAEDFVRRVHGPHEDLFGHGTACAGIIRRTAPECRLHSIRVLGERLTGKGAVFAAGLEEAIARGFRVVNLSLSTGRADQFGPFHELADRAYFAGVMLVCAINNVPTPSYPSQYASVFSVAAHDRTDPFGLDYNPRPPVEFGAPGIDVEVAWRGGGTTVTTGNSFAAPHLAGLIARILSKHPQLTPFHVKTVLHAVADNARVPRRSGS